MIRKISAVNITRRTAINDVSVTNEVLMAQMSAEVLTKRQFSEEH